jgi:hypothetical protein
MTDDMSRWCVLMPCSNTEAWAVPQNCLAEIVTLHDVAERPPETVLWRGVNLPVLDFGDDDGSVWREHRSGTGLVAIFLGLEGEGCDYWGVAIRGEGLAVKRVASGEVKDSHEAVREHARAAFSLHGTVYQVPDLAALQKKITASQEMA